MGLAVKEVGAKAESMPSSSQRISEVLFQSWRKNTRPYVVSTQDLATISEPLITMGSGVLAWQGLSNSTETKDCDAYQRLEEMARTAPLAFAIYREAVARASQLISDACGAPPIVIKGWSAARYYDKPYARPIGDIDLIAPPGGFEAAKEALRHHALGVSPAARPGIARFTLDIGLPYVFTQVDLHRSLDKFRLGANEALFDRAETLVIVPDVLTRVLAPEDDLALLSIHMLRHGGRKPSWLIDIAALLEQLPDEFDWQACLTDESVRRDWIATCCRLAQELLGADQSRVPAWISATSAPLWVTRSILRQWSKPYRVHTTRPTLVNVLKGYGDGILREIEARWPDPIYASLELNRGPQAGPQLLYQLAFVAKRSVQYLSPKKHRFPSF